MTTRRAALAEAQKWGFVLDDRHSGSDPGGGFNVLFDHPTHSIGFDCRSIVEYSYQGSGRTASQNAWDAAIERMRDEGPLLERCANPECDYHNPEEEDDED